jgi:tRNA pseudouridine38-40 synthase
MREPVLVNGVSRTDAGVNARGFAVNFKTDSTDGPDRILNGLNGLLPPDIKVTEVAVAEDAWHARKSATWREYEYLIWNRPGPDIFRRETVYHCPKSLDLNLMRQGAAALVGKHDFRAFCVASSAPKGCVRTVMNLGVDAPEPGLIRIKIRADGFVHKMVRSIAGTLIDIGLGRLDPGVVEQMLITGDRELAGKTAPAKGLTLTRIGYDEGI